MQMAQPGLKYADVTDKIIGIFYDLYNELGYGFFESVYEEAMVIALREAGLVINRQVPVPVWFRNQKIGEYRADLVVEKCVLIELKCARTLDAAHEAQVLHCLKSTDIELGLLVNFGSSPQFRRLLFDKERKKIRENPCKSVAEVSA
jgi:GxxExxY protein